jgi:putative ABC transport system ATP-binding protein
MISCKAITKSYTKGVNTVTPLENLSLEVPRGDFLALMGPSGSGKTTLLNLISGIDTPTSGILEIDGEDIARFSRSQLTQWRARKVGYIFQLYHLIPVLTAFENVELPLLITSLSRAERRRKAEAALDIVGLSDRSHHTPGELSGGQEQRVAIARALVADPALLVADEPTGDLDRENAESMMELITTLCQEFQKTFVIVTHDPKVAERASRVLHMDKGILVENQPAQGKSAPPAESRQ